MILSLAIVAIDWTQVVVGVVAGLAMVAAALANSRGRKQEKTTQENSVTVQANNLLIDQLQESLKDYRDENSELHTRLNVLGIQITEIRAQLGVVTDERDEFRRLLDNITA